MTLDEEVSIQTEYEDRCVGMINDDETEVGKVHLGIVHIFDVRQQSVFPREDEMLCCGVSPVRPTVPTTRSNGKLVAHLPGRAV